MSPQPDQPPREPRSRGLGGLWSRIARADWIDTRAAQSEIERLDRRYPHSQRFYAVFAAAACATLAAPVSVMEIAFACFALCPLIGLIWTWRLLPAALLLPAVLAGFLFTAWTAISLLWSPDPSLGLEHLARARWLLFPIALIPVLNRRRTIIASMLAGFAVYHVAQITDALNLIDYGRFDSRASAWFSPAVSGSILMVPLGLHLGVLVFGKGAWRIVGAAGASAALLGIALTGSRGAWIGAPLLCLVAFLIELWRVSPRRRLVYAGLAPLSAALLVGVIWIAAGDRVRERIDEARAEIARAVDHHDYRSSTGARIAMYRWAWDAWLDRPVHGLGAGGFEPLARVRAETESPPLGNEHIHTHAHSTYLDAAATTGAVGLLLALAFTGAALAGAVSPKVGEPPAAANDPTGLERAPALAMLGLLLVTPFDTLYVNNQTAALIGFLIAIGAPWRPRCV